MTLQSATARSHHAWRWAGVGSCPPMRKRGGGGAGRRCRSRVAGTLGFWQPALHCCHCLVAPPAHLITHCKDTCGWAPVEAQQALQLNPECGRFHTGMHISWRHNLVGACIHKTYLAADGFARHGSASPLHPALAADCRQFLPVFGGLALHLHCTALHCTVLALHGHAAILGCT